MALAIFKQNCSGYRFLSKIFALPSRVTLMKLLNNIPIEPGFNNYIFDALAQNGQYLPKIEKACVLIFDEMSLMPHLHYNHFTDNVEGFENFGDSGSEQIADHVQVFMLRGIKRKWKQPIYYHFVKGAVKTVQMVKTIKQLIVALSNVGFDVVATICDQGTNNVSAINQLVNETRTKYIRLGMELKHHIFEIDDRVVIPLYDPPHLLKGIRNNLLSKDIQYQVNGVTKVAKWEDIHKAWLMDNFSGELRAMPKLTEFHTNKLKIKKMKVAIAAQVFSHTVSSTIHLMAKSSYVAIEGIKMDTRAIETAEFCKFVDNLFDSVNGYGKFNKHGKPLRSAITTSMNNYHENFWRSTALPIISTIQCIGGDGKCSRPPTFNNWELTLHNLMLLSKTLNEMGFQYFNPRYLNQDPLENFFGKVRQKGQRFVNPTCTAFRQYYKSLLVNNMVSKQSVGSNCEDDKCNVLLSLQKFLTQGKQICKELNMDSLENFEAIDLPLHFNKSKSLEECIVGYVAGYLSKLKLNLKNCTACKYNILKRKNENYSVLHEFIVCKDYGVGRLEKLKYCNVDFIVNLIKVYNIVKYILKKHPYREKISKIISTLQKNINFNFVECEHSSQMQVIIFKQFTKLLIFNYFNGINNILSGKDRRKLPENCSNLMQQATQMCNKYKNK